MDPDRKEVMFTMFIVPGTGSSDVSLNKVPQGFRQTKHSYRVHKDGGDMSRQYQEGSIEQATKKLQVSLVTTEISF